MHSKALVKTHLFINIAESLDILFLNHEVAGNAGAESACVDGVEVFVIMCRGGKDVIIKMCA